MHLDNIRCRHACARQIYSAASVQSELKPVRCDGCDTLFSVCTRIDCPRCGPRPGRELMFD